MVHPDAPAFLRRLRKLTDSYKDRMMVGEISGDEDPLKHYVEYTGAPEVLHTAYNFSFLSRRNDAAFYRDVINELGKASSYSWPAWAFSNHDFPRAATRLAKDSKISKDQVKMLNALLLSLRGTPFVYQGEELGLGEVTLTYEQLQDPLGKYLWPENQGRDGCRTPMPWDHAKPNGGFSAHGPWLPVPKDHLDNAVDVQEKDKNSPLNFFRSFVAWRKQHPSLISGDIKFFDTQEPILAFARGDIIVVFNPGGKTGNYTLPEGTKPLDGHNLPYQLAGNRLTLPAFGGFFGEIK
jgi:alpha-glucosidase